LDLETQANPPHQSVLTAEMESIPIAFATFCTVSLEESNLFV